MKNTIKLALVAAALGAATSAQAYVNGDLLVGFDGNGTDYIYDLGAFSSLANNETWNLGAAFGLSNLGTDFGVVGASAAGLASSHIFVTSSDPGENGFVQSSGQLAGANIKTIGGTLTALTGRTTTPSDTTGWTFQTDQPAGTPGNTFFNNYFNPNTTVGSTAYFFNNANGLSTADGSFAYNSSSGMLTFTAVPEPTTFGLVAGLGVLLLAVRRQFANA